MLELLKNKGFTIFFTVPFAWQCLMAILGNHGDYYMMPALLWVSCWIAYFIGRGGRDE